MLRNCRRPPHIKPKSSWRKSGPCCIDGAPGAPMVGCICWPPGGTMLCCVTAAGAGGRWPRCCCSIICCCCCCCRNCCCCCWKEQPGFLNMFITYYYKTLLCHLMFGFAVIYNHALFLLPGFLNFVRMTFVPMIRSQCYNVRAMLTGSMAYLIE